MGPCKKLNSFCWGDLLQSAFSHGAVAEEKKKRRPEKSAKFKAPFTAIAIETVARICFAEMVINAYREATPMVVVGEEMTQVTIMALDLEITQDTTTAQDLDQAREITQVTTTAQALEIIPATTTAPTREIIPATTTAQAREITQATTTARAREIAQATTTAQAREIILMMISILDLGELAHPGAAH